MQSRGCLVQETQQGPPREEYPQWGVLARQEASWIGSQRLLILGWPESLTCCVNTGKPLALSEPQTAPQWGKNCTSSVAVAPPVVLVALAVSSPCCACGPRVTGTATGDSRGKRAKMSDRSSSRQERQLQHPDTSPAQNSAGTQEGSWNGIVPVGPRFANE